MSVAGSEVSLHDFAGRKVFLVFTQAGCGPCQQIMPELNKLGGRDVQVLVLNKGDAKAPITVRSTHTARAKNGLLLSCFARLSRLGG
jgi:hypothetical protein